MVFLFCLFCFKGRCNVEQVLINTLQGQGIWTVCSVLLVVFVIKDSKAREEKLMDHLDRTNEAHEKIAKSMDSLERRMENVETLSRKGEL